ncbi:MAG: undecaprenyldiphospho-muramoylpentapeptide beta-N-acetylglucosaminyltransferase [Lachnospiraceae bacterium]|nr:undecaprenyldiphospho-muramoylpentapeptide beta-N-acetylglucosaminyltransferase [Lachnospiraceae bacterium]MBQ2251082.1 undecaprenyldiphospho-muramoylpentapeptide beta-N-acetylglucosaminyltransferase [Lachnospiraceae bacterium]MBQ2401977.1 undecaprenyldiphospho-muramoylpentapeptide beta-N-acetylglucosaminyltransferase [Lachnospiraceae bacterium]MBQ5806042.1 undecaprenyldiphospho-muramoylpentapeptide beta-N-acetylglucosaminyltransferase [Lachnospiraceae bacterium]MBQ5915802.1 undecaprenyldiph
MKTIILTGGGTAGHVTPNLALLPSLKEAGYDVHYIGSYNGIERKLIENAGIPYEGISSGKLRRYFDLKNFTDPLRVVKGYFEACKLMKKHKPDVVFSKGGFVAVPVVLAAKRYKVPTIIHESDMTPGLANKLCIPSAKKVCCNFPETLKYLPSDKAVLSGSPIRAELLTGDRLSGLQYTNLSAAKPIILVIGGSLGSVKVNTAIRSILPKLLEKFQVIHICGKGHIDESLIGTAGYVQYEYVDSPLKHLFAAANIIVSRAGANSICEILALRKPNVLIPLSAAASRGDQILNANSFKKQGYSTVLEEETVTDETLYDAITETYENRHTFIETMEKSQLNNAVDTIMQLINQYAGN